MRGAPAARVDPGLQPERTSLSWVRCAAAVAALAVLFVRCMPGPGPATAAVGGMLLLCAALLVCTARGRHRRSCADFEQEYARPQWGWHILLLVTVLAPAVVGAITVVQDSV